MVNLFNYINYQDNKINIYDKVSMLQNNYFYKYHKYHQKYQRLQHAGANQAGKIEPTYIYGYLTDNRYGCLMNDQSETLPTVATTDINDDFNYLEYCHPDDLLSQEQLDQFHKDGYLVIKHIRDQQFCNNFVDEIWRAICEAPWVPGQGILEIPNGPFAKLKGKNADPKDKAWLNDLHLNKASEKKWFPGGFSAPAIPPMFNLTHSWENRQAPKFYCPFAQILTNESGHDMHKLWCSIDRVSVKPPGMGDQDSFYHWDSDPWYWDQDKYVGLQGMLSLSDGTTFTLFTGTHTLEFRDTITDRETGFLRNYSTKKHWVSQGDRGNHEPMVIIDKALNHYVDDRKRVVELEKGDLIIWSNRLLHLASKNKSDYMRYSQYIQFDPAGRCKNSQGEYINQNPNILPNGDRDEIITGFRKQGLSIPEVDTRIYSWETGKKPAVYPSGGPTTNALRPDIWKTQMKPLNTRYALRFINSDDNPTRKINSYQNSTQISEDGKYYDNLLGKKSYPYEVIQWDPKKVIGKDGYPIYVKPKLTNLGMKLLGLKCW